MNWACHYSSVPEPDDVKLIPKNFKFGSVDVSWDEIKNDPGFVCIEAHGSSLSDEELACMQTEIELRRLGYIVSKYKTSFSEFSSWQDVQEKGLRLFRDGNVRIEPGHNMRHFVDGYVKGDDPSTQVDVVDHHRVRPPPPYPQQTYYVWFKRDDPNSASFTEKGCTCKWNEFAHGRGPHTKIPENRDCSHIRALWHASVDRTWRNGGKFDDDLAPETQYRRTPQERMFPVEPAPPSVTFPGQEQPIPAGGEVQTPISQPPLGVPPAGAIIPPQQEGIPVAQPSQTAFLPSQGPPYVEPQELPGQMQLIPPSLEELQQMQQAQAVSWPGKRPPSPNHFLQYPGETLSHIVRAQNEYVFQPGDVVRVNQATYAQKMRGEGYTNTGEWANPGTDAGEWIEIPRNSQGEIVDYDSTTGFAAVDFPQQNGPATSYFARAYIEGNLLSLVNRQPRPTPFMQRR
jgi:hypothetical protein